MCIISFAHAELPSDTQALNLTLTAGERRAGLLLVYFIKIGIEHTRNYKRVDIRVQTSIYIYAMRKYKLINLGLLTEN